MLGTQVVSTLALLGLIWFVQIVHYPLFLRIAPADFAAFETEHANRTGFVAAPLMIAELLSALLLLSPGLRPATIPSSQALWGAALAVAVWVSTFAVQVPLHNRLHRGFDKDAIRRLVTTNWVRTAIWTARSCLITFWILRLH